MKKLLLIALILSAGTASFAATKTCTASPCLFSSGTNWNGGTAPVDGDLIVTGAFAVTQDVAGRIVGDKAGTGIGVSCSVSGGSFTATAATTLRGTNTTTAPFFNSVANCTINLSGQAITMDGPTTYTTGISNGIYIDSSSTTIDIPAGNITWSNASGNNTYGGVTSNPFDQVSDIFAIKLSNVGGSLTDPGPVSNNAGSGLGSFGDTSIHFTSGGFNAGATHVEKDCSTVFSGAVQITAVLTTNGDFCIDYPKGVLYYKSSVATLTVVLDFKYGTWGGWGIVATNNAANSSISINGTYGHCGDVSQTGEQVGGGFMTGDKYALGIGHDSQDVTFGSSVVFNYCFRPISLYAQNITSTSASFHIALTGATFNNCRYNSAAFQDGLIQLGYENFIDVTSPTLNSFTNLFVRTGRTNGNSQKNIIVTGATGNGSNGGHWMPFHPLPGALTSGGFGTGSSGNGLAGNSSFKNAVALNGFNQPDVLSVSGGVLDGAFVSVPGDPTDGNNTYDNNQLNYLYRSGRIDNYETITNNRTCRTSHHGYTLTAENLYIDGSTITFSGNTTCDFLDTNNFPGGVTFSYNQNQWLDSLVATHNTLDGGLRCINFNDGESAVVSLITRVQAINNICSNNNQGIFRPTGTAPLVSSIALAKNDYNLDYNNTANPTNLTQATFMRNAAEYNTGTRNVAGVYLFNPLGYSLPDATSRSLVLTSAGTAGTNLSLTVAWSGGTGVDFVQDQGTLSAYGTTSCGNAMTCSLLTDSSKSATWVASDATHQGFRGYQVITTSGTGSGQYCMIISNTTTALTCLANRKGNDRLTVALDATSKYIIIKPDQQLFDSGASNSVRAGIHSPTLVLTTQTDSGITMALNRPTAASPNYVNSAFPSYNFHPRLSTLNGTASDGTFIGAFSIQANGCGFTILLGGVGCN